MALWIGLLIAKLMLLGCSILSFMVWPEAVVLNQWKGLGGWDPER
jgi:hypothetical protein